MKTDAGYAVELVIIPAFFWRFDFLQYTWDLFASGTKMQCLQITLPMFGIPYSEICVPEEKNHHLRCNFILGIKWTCLKYSIFTLSGKVKQGYRYNVFAGLFHSKWLQGIFFSHRKAGLLGTWRSHVFCILVLKQNQQSYIVPDRLV